MSKIDGKTAITIFGNVFKDLTILSCVYMKINGKDYYIFATTEDKDTINFNNPTYAMDANTGEVASVDITPYLAEYGRAFKKHRIMLK